MREHIGAQPRQHHLEYHDHREAERDDIEGRETPMHEDLVHHHLEEQRRDQRK